MTMTLYDIDIPCTTCGGFLYNHIADCPDGDTPDIPASAPIDISE
jgi:hypothetical protein